MMSHEGILWAARCRPFSPDKSSPDGEDDAEDHSDR